MRVFGLMFCLLSLPLIAATELTTKIYDIDYGTKAGDDVLVFLTSGHVAKLRESNHLFNKGMSRIDLKKGWFKVTLDEERFITDLEPAKSPVPETRFTMNRTKSIDNYVPTTIESMATAKKYFREARYYPKDSQCFNRAQVWSYEWWKNHSLRSNKILIYFTRNYIRRYNFEWWFHIAPLIHVMDDGKVVERVMDIKYTKGPLELVKWSNIFMRNDAPCPIITKFSEYADYPYTGDCFLQRTHMYTYQPADLQMYEAWGYSKENWNMDEVRGAYLEAFDERI